MVHAAAVLLISALVESVVPGNSVWAATGFPPSTNVILFTPPYRDPLVARLEAELAAVGIAVRRLPTPPDPQLDSEITRQITAGASAAIRVIPRSRGTEVWTGDTTARMLRRRSIRADTSDAALSVIALRTVEFLRASLLDVKRRGIANSATAKTPGDQTAVRETAAAEKVGIAEGAEASTVRPAETPPIRPTEVPAVRPAEIPAVSNVDAPPDAVDGTRVKPGADTPVETPRSIAPDTESARFEIAAGPAVLASAGGTTPIVSGAATGRAWFTDRVGMELMAMFPMVPSRLTKPEGSIEFQAALFGGGATFRLTPPGHWTADVTGGGCAMLFRAAGSGIGTVRDAPNSGRVDSIWKVAAYVRIGGGVQINRWVVLRADVIVGMTPSSRIILEYSVTDNLGTTTVVDRATWGPTFSAGTLGLQAAW